MRFRRRYVAVALVGVAVATLSAQRRSFFGGDFPVEGNPSYDGRLTFMRLRYPGYGGLTNEGPGWMHDYPTAERHLTKILSEVSYLQPRTDSSSVLDFGNPEIMRYPILYFSEPGYWQPTDEDVKNIHDYLMKGGFMVVDDFRIQHWYNLQEQMARVFEKEKLNWIPVELSQPVWDSFFRIDAADLQRPGIYGPPVQYLGLFENNDPTKRLMVIANYNNDVGDAWQWSDQGFLPIDLTNEAYKLGVNYIMYALTH
jgi:uncharacterized protein DUF4159